MGNGADLQTGNSEDSTHTAVIDIPTDASSSDEAPPGGGPVHEPSPPPSLPPIATTAADAASGSQRARTDPARPYRHWLTRWRGLRERPAAGDGGSEADSTPATPLLADAAWEAAAEGGPSRMEEEEDAAGRMEDDGEDGGGADRSSCLPAGSSLSRYVSRLSDSLGRSRSVASLAGGQHGACLICLEPFTPEELESGEAIALDCECRGEVAMRHYACAVKWIKVKGDLVCDVCKAEVRCAVRWPILPVSGMAALLVLGAAMAVMVAATSVAAPVMLGDVEVSNLVIVALVVVGSRATLRFVGAEVSTVAAAALRRMESDGISVCFESGAVAVAGLPMSAGPLCIIVHSPLVVKEKLSSSGWGSANPAECHIASGNCDI